MDEKRKIVLKPCWRSWFWVYLAGFALLPLFGIGLIVLWAVHKKRTSELYEIHDRFIVSHSGSESRRLDLVNIEEVSVFRTRTEKILRTGTVKLAANVSVIELQGMEEPHELAGMIRAAIETERTGSRQPGRQRKREPEHDPGTLDKMDYLTGLWQQGLISEEDYRKEKRHFE